MASLADMTVTLGLDDANFTKGIKEAENNVKKFGSTSEKEISRTSELFGKLKTALAGIAFGELITKSAQFGSDIVNTAKSLQTSTEAVYAWRTAIGNAGGDLDNARDALIDLTQKMSEAITSGGDVLTAFNRIGISIKDLQGKSNEDIMKLVIKGLANVKDGAERSRLALILMGEDVKNVDWRSVANDYDKLAENAKKISPALEQARNSQKQFNDTYNKFLEQVTMNVPWDDLSAGLKSIGDNLGTIASLVKIMFDLGVAYLTITKVLPFFSAGQKAVYESIGKATTAFSTMGTVVYKMLDMMTAQFAIFVGGILNAGKVIFNFGNTSVGVIESLSLAMTGLAAAASRLLIFYTVAEAANSLVKALTGLTPLDDILSAQFKNWGRDLEDFGSVIDYIKIKYLGFSGDLEKATKNYDRAMENYMLTPDELAKKEKDNLKKIVDETENWYDEASKIEEKQNKVSKLLQDQKKDLESIHQQYKNQNEQTLAKLQLDNSLIVATEEQKRVQTEMMNIENQRQQVVQGLQDKIKDAHDPAIIKEYNNAIAEVNKNFDVQKQKVSGLISENVKLSLNKQVDNIVDKDKIDKENTLTDLQNERAKIFLPLIEQKYKDIEIAANKAYEAQVQAFADQNYGGDTNKIPQDYINKLKQSRDERIKSLKDEAKLTDESFNSKKYLSLLEQSGLENAKQVRDIQNEIAYSTMPVYEQISAKLTNSAKERAQITIDEINSTRQYKMSASEAQTYYDAANNGLDELIKKQQESYIISRQWNTGWTKAMNDYIENATNAAKVAENVFSKAMSGLEDAFISFTKTGKFEWKSFVNSMVEELLRAQFRQLMASMFTGLGAGGQKQSSGGVLSNLFSGFFAEGGSIPGGKWGIVGEAGPEIVQGPANITPMNKLGPSSTTHVSYNINAVDAMSFKQMIAADPSFMYAVSEQGRRRLAGAR